MSRSLCLYGCTCVHLHTEAPGQLQMLFLGAVDLVFAAKVFDCDLGLTHLADLEIPFSLPPQLWDHNACHHTQLLTG